MTLRKTCAGISRVVGKISTVFLVLGMIAVAAIALISSVDSIGRYIFGSALRGASEYVETGMAIFVYGGLAMAIRERKCVIVPVILETMKPRLRTIFVSIGNFCCGAVGIIVSMQVWKAAIKHMGNLAYTTEVVKLPYGPFYLFGALGLTLVTIELFIIAIKDLDEFINYKKLHANDQTPAAETKSESEVSGK